MNRHSDHGSSSVRQAVPPPTLPPTFGALSRVVLAFVALLWFVSLWVAPVMLLVFDSDVSVEYALQLGLIQATWVAGIPVALLLMWHFVSNGLVWPSWRWRWVLVLGLVLLWVLILALWIAAAATDDPYT